MNYLFRYPALSNQLQPLQLLALLELRLVGIPANAILGRLSAQESMLSIHFRVYSGERLLQPINFSKLKETEQLTNFR